MTFASSLTSMLLDPGTGVLIGLLVVAAWIDWRTMRIPNWLTVAGMVWGLAYNLASATSALDGLGLSLGGIGIAMALFLPLWLLRAMGAGDVKLMAMVGSFLGAFATFKAMVFVGLVGGVMVIVFVIAHRAGGQLARNLRNLAYSAVLPGVPLAHPTPSTSVGKLPYGVSIGIGTVLFLLLRQVGLA